MTNRTCTVEDCENDYKAKGMCHKHYVLFARTGSTKTLPKLSPEQRFWAKVEKTDTCWNWAGGKCSGGYGRYTPVRTSKMAHRYSWETLRGPIPAGMFLDHACHNKVCVNPAHLRLATCKQNNENRQGPQANNIRSGVRGVHKNGAGWSARVGHNGEVLHFGTYPTIAEAEAVVIEARRKLFTHSQN